MEYKNLKIIGTSHISQDSVEEITSYISKEKPHIVAVELDKDRVVNLMNPQEEKQKINYKSIRTVGLKGFLFGLIGSWASKKMGKMVGMNPGDDMKSAIISASMNDAKIMLIDQHISITLSQISKRLTFKEKWRFFVDVVKGVFSPKKQAKKFGIESLNLSEVPSEELIEKMLEHVKLRYPNFYNVLVHDRNIYMGRKLVHLMITNPDKKILAVVGAGHKKGMIAYIEEHYEKELEKMSKQNSDNARA